MERKRRGGLSAKQTGGGGFNFADNVALTLSLHLLLGKSIFGLNAAISEIQFESKAGWKADDLVLTLNDKGQTFKIGCSVKSYSVITGKSLSDKVVRPLLQDVLCLDGSPFKPQQDFLAILASPGTDEGESTLNELIRDSREKKPANLIGDTQSKVRVDILKSLSDLIPEGQDIALVTSRLLSRLIYQTYDFESVSSKSREKESELLRELCPKVNESHSSNLRTQVLDLIREMRACGGFLNYQKLSERLQQFHIVGRQDFRKDLRAVKDFSDRSLQNLSPSIAAKVNLPRLILLSKFSKEVLSVRSTIVTGRSGIGKSCLCKMLLQAEEVPTLWIDCRDELSERLNDLRKQLEHGLGEIVENTRTTFYFILDSVERISTESDLKSVRQLLAELSAIKSNGLRVLIVCEESQLGAFSTRLKAEIDKLGTLTTFTVPEATAEERDIVAQQFSGLAVIFNDKRLTALLSNPKVLDLVCRREDLRKSASSKRFTGEIDLIDWIWDGLVHRPSQRPKHERLLLFLGEKQAHENRSRTPKNEISDTLIEAIPALCNERLIIEKDQKVAFEHDILSHWARFQILKGRDENLSGFLASQKASFFWNEAVRLYGQWLLEGARDPSKWIKVFEELNNDDNTRIFADDVLDSALYLFQSGETFEDLRKYLLADKGKKIVRFFRRFLVRGTTPRPGLADFFRAMGEPELITFSEAHDRIPIFYLWPGILNFIAINISELKTFAFDEILKIAKAWIQNTHVAFPFRQRMSEVACELAEYSLETRDEYAGRYQVSDESAKLAYETVLLAAEELPKKVIEFGRRAAKLAVTDAQIIADRKALENRNSSSWRYGSEEYAAPLLHGPRDRIEEEFIVSCLKSGALAPLMRVEPQAARQLILACLIREPGMVTAAHRSLSMDFGLRSRNGDFYPPFYTKGPFLIFLKINFSEALKLIVDLVSTVTIAWGDERGGLNDFNIVQPDGSSKTWRGTWEIYNWYRNQAHTPGPVASALMALERFLYEQIENNNSVEPFILQILETGNSLAFLGVLSAVAKKTPDLLNGPLGLIVQVPDFQEWENQLSIQEMSSLQLLGWNFPNTPLVTRRLASEWHSMPERRSSISDVACRYWLSHPESEFAQQVDQWVSKWKSSAKESSNNAEKVSLERLCRRFDRATWELCEIQGHKGWRNTAEIPLEEQEDAEMALHLASLTLIAGCCRRILDNDPKVEKFDPDQLGIKYRKILEFAKTKNQSVNNSDYQGALTGIAAVLGQFQYEWLEKQPEMMKACREVTLGALNVLLNPPKGDSQFQHLIWSTSENASHALAGLWIRQPSDMELREALARLITVGGSKLVQIIVSVSRSHKKTLGNEFNQLIALGWERAVRFTEIASARRIARYSTIPTEKISKEHESWQKTTVEGFVAGKIAGGRTLKKCVEPPSPPAEVEDRIHALEYNIDSPTIQALFSQFGGREAHFSSESDFKEGTAFLSDAIDALTLTLEPFRDCENRFDERPTDFDRWILTGAGILLAQSLDEFCESIWKKILDLGPAAETYLEAFMTSFILAGLQSSDRSCFVVTWKKMLAYAFSNKLWSMEGKATPQWRNVDEGWLTLMGLDPLMVTLWSEDTSGVINSLEDEILSWAERHLSMTECRKQFVRFLNQSGATKLRVKGLVKLATQFTSMKNKSPTLRENEFNSLAEMLDAAFRDNWAEIKNNVIALQAFNDLLAWLIRHQHPVGIHIAEKVATAL